MKPKEKISLLQALRLHGRAFHLLSRCCPGLFPAHTLLALVTAVTPYVTVFFSARLIDELTGGRDPALLLRWALLALFSAAVLGMLTYAFQQWVDTGFYRLTRRHIRLFDDKMLSMDYADVESQTVRDQLDQILQNDNWSMLGLRILPRIYRVGLQSLTGILSAAVLIAGLFTARVPAGSGWIGRLDHPAAVLLFAALMLLPALLSPYLSGKVGALENSERMAGAARLGNRVWMAFGFLFHATNRGPDVRMYRQDRFVRHYMEKTDPWGPGGAFTRLTQGRGGLLYGLSSAVPALGTGVVYGYVCLKAWAGAFGVGMVTQYVSALTALTGNITDLFRQVAEVRTNAPYVRDTLAFLTRPNAMYQGSLTTEKRADRQYDVEFQDVSFRYPGSETWALRHLSVRFAVGKRLAVVGENGSGKTTFIKLLCRLYDPQEGRILLNGIDIRKYDYRDYMDVFSVVFQDFQLLPQPLGANVAGASRYDEARVRKALADAGFDERLARMDKGLDTMLYKDFDKDGVEISGGEAQKIAIARALYRNAPFLILDEPTAALDPIAEAEIYAHLDRIVDDRTAVYISHRLSSCRFCDEILVFDRGRIVQRGGHEALLRDEAGLYHRLWHAQAQYYEAG